MLETVRAAVRRDLRTTVVAVVAASVVAGPSAAAAYIANADKVDHKHAVGSGASVSVRKGKLVATNRTTGFLPANIISKALNSEKLDGRDSRAFLTAKGKAADSNQLDGRDSTELVPRQVSASFGDPDHEPLATLTRTVDNIAQVSIEVPGAGRVQVDGQTVVQVQPDPNNYAFAQLSISTVPSAHDPSPAGSAFWDVPTSDGNGLYRATIPTTRTFTITEPGVHTYYIVASGSGDPQEPAGGPLHYTTQVNAQYFPVP